jgi:hypothetical protein
MHHLPAAVVVSIARDGTIQVKNHEVETVASAILLAVLLFYFLK